MICGRFRYVNGDVSEAIVLLRGLSLRNTGIAPTKAQHTIVTMRGKKFTMRSVCAVYNKRGLLESRIEVEKQKAKLRGRRLLRR